HSMTFGAVTDDGHRAIEKTLPVTREQCAQSIGAAHGVSIAFANDLADGRFHLGFLSTRVGQITSASEGIRLWEYVSSRHNEIEQRCKHDSGEIRGYQGHTDYLLENPGKYSVRDDGNEAVRQVKPSEAAKTARGWKAPPCPGLMPNEIVQYGDFDRQNCCGDHMEAEHTGKEPERGELDPGADDSNRVELEPADHCGERVSAR